MLSRRSLVAEVHLLVNSLQPLRCKFCDNNTILNILGGKVTQSKYCSTICKNKDLSTIMLEAVKSRDELSAQKKREDTLLRKTGYKYNSQNPIHKAKLAKDRTAHSDLLFYLEDKEWMNNAYTINKRPSELIAEDLFKLTGHRICYGTVLDYMSKHNIPRVHFNRSSIEIKLSEALIAAGIPVDSGKKTFDSNKQKEIDVYISQHKLGIEVNGLYHHSFWSKETQVEVNKHKWKTEEALKEGITLIQFTDEQIKNNLELVVSMIKSRCKMNERIGARECQVRIIDTAIAKEFLKQNHISGFAGASIKLGLYKDDALVSVLTMSKPRFDKTYDWEVIRFATIMGTTVVGGFSKLLKHFRIINPGSIVTYADRATGEGNVYKNSGFTFVKSTDPGYVWTDGDVIIPRYRTMKSVISTVVPGCDLSMTEEQIMFGAGYKRYWNSGNNVYVMSD